MSDYIASLPTDSYPVDSNDEKILDTILDHERSTFFKIISELKQPLIAGALFLTLNTDFADRIIQMIVPYTQKSSFSVLIFKTFLFIFLLFIIQNLSLALKSG